MTIARSLSYRQQSPTPSNAESMDCTEASLKEDRSKQSSRLPAKKKTKSMGNLSHKNLLDQDALATPPRPANAWILYRSTKVKELKERQLRDTSSSSSATHGGGVQAEVSKIISDMWKSEKEEVKQSFMKMAEERKKSHLEMFPNYKYRPKRNNTTLSKSNLLQNSPLKPTRSKLAKAKSFYIDTKKSRLESTEGSQYGSMTSSSSSSVTSSVDSFAPLLNSFSTLLSSPIDVNWIKTTESHITTPDWSFLQELTSSRLQKDEQRLNNVSTTAEVAGLYASDSIPSNGSSTYYNAPIVASQSVPAWSTKFEFNNNELSSSSSSQRRTSAHNLSRQLSSLTTTSTPQIWNTPSSVSSWQSEFIPSQCSAAGTVPDAAGGNYNNQEIQYPQSPLPAQPSSTSSPFRAYAELSNGNNTFSLSPLYLGIPDLRPDSSNSNDTAISSFAVPTKEEDESLEKYLPGLSTHLSLPSFATTSSSSEGDEGDVTVNIHGTTNNSLNLSNHFEYNHLPLSAQVSRMSISSSSYTNSGIDNQSQLNHHENFSSSLPFLSPPLSTFSSLQQPSPTESAQSNFPPQSEPEHLLITSDPFDDIMIHMNTINNQQHQEEQQQQQQQQQHHHHQQVVGFQRPSISQQFIKSQSMTWHQQDFLQDYHLKTLSQQ